jgi:dihydroorotase
MRLHRVQILGRQGLSEPRDVELPVDHADLDAAGLVLSPGWCDLHAHLREPGFPEKETLATGAAAAAAGGFTQVVAMANTQPVTDTAERVRANLARARDLPVRILFVGALTEGLEGRRPTDAVGLKAAGAVALSDDGRHALDLHTLVAALRNATAAGLPVLVHPQDESLGSEPAAELAAVGQALAALRQVPQARLHLQHVSLATALPLIAEAKRAGLALTAEATPHHLWLTSDALRRWGALAKVNPPLQTEHDVAALRNAVIDGTIDVVATDHAPHEAAAKRDVETSAPGISGFETAAGILLTLGLPWPVVYRACVAGPRTILGIPVPPDWILIDPAETWTVEPDRFVSRGRNTPLAGTRLTGRVRMTICRHQVVHQAEVPVG